MQFQYSCYYQSCSSIAIYGNHGKQQISFSECPAGADRKKTAKLIAFDAAAMAKEAGNVMFVNMVLLGALIQTGTVPLSAENIKEAIMKRTRKAFVESNLKAFDIGFVAAEALS